MIQVHVALAMFAKEPALMIEEREARMIATASLDLMAQYGAAIDPRAMAWANFTMAIASVYGPRAVAIIVKRKQAAHERAKQQAT